jgi:hypothetical protein
MLAAFKTDPGAAAVMIGGAVLMLALGLWVASKLWALVPRPLGWRREELPRPL